MTKELYALLRPSADVILILLQTGGPAQMHYGRTCTDALWEAPYRCIMGGPVQMHYGRPRTDALWEALHRCIKFLKKYYYTLNMHILKNRIWYKKCDDSCSPSNPAIPSFSVMCKYKRRYVNFLYILNWISSKFAVNQQFHWRHAIENIHTERRTGSNFIINIPSLHGAHHMFSLMFMTRNEFIKVSAVNMGLPCC